MKRSLTLCLAIVTTVLLLLCARAAFPAKSNPAELDEKLQTGRVLLLLLGMPGCPGTEKATEALIAYAREKPDDVLIFRVDVPPPSGVLPDDVPWSAPFPRVVDGERRIAGRLDFFFYPTFYIVDREGEVRFAGECAIDDVRRMVGVICKEAPGAAKRQFTVPMPSPGTAAAEIALPLLDGRPGTLSSVRGKLGTLLYFGSTECPFSTAGAMTLPEIQRVYEPKGIAVAVVNRGQSPGEIRAFYEKSVPGVRVFLDEDRAVSVKQYGVTAVPFFYLLDGAGLIVERRPFTEDAARSAIDTLLGIRQTEKVEQKKGGG